MQSAEIIRKLFFLDGFRWNRDELISFDSPNIRGEQNLEMIPYYSSKLPLPISSKLFEESKVVQWVKLLFSGCWVGLRDLVFLKSSWWPRARNIRNWVINIWRVRLPLINGQSRPQYSEMNDNKIKYNYMFLVLQKRM